MKPVTLKELERIACGRIIQGDPGTVLSSVSTDTRRLKKGEIFFALSGERHDAHNFLAQAAGAGAGCLVVSRTADLPAGVPVLAVENTLAALQALAAFNRKSCGARVVAVTGSTGKTTTKDMTASILSTRLRTLKSEGNFNNEIGLPLTLLRLDETCEIAVVEMAMRGAGEIDALCRIAKPDCAVITNIGEAHLELLGTVSNIAAAKGEVLEHIPAGGFALLNAEAPFIRREAGRCRGKVIYYGIDCPADIRAANIRPEGRGSRFEVILDGERREFFLPVPGRHNVMNALAAIGVARELGLTWEEVARGLAAVTLTGMRLEIIEAKNLRIINDAYNANPASAKAALQVLKEMAGGRRAVAVMGNMLELGPRAAEGHREVGEAAAGARVSCLVTVGDLAAGIAEGALDAGLPAERIFRCADNMQAAGILEELIRDGDVVLVKGSRGMKMEEIVRCLLKSREPALLQEAGPG
ncbi:MAG: UDP-N-acetylmuramoyl-tripeptide--D-alanyl-D-alanine ligase [Pelotomaculum sp.]|nr:UDP-N-acetylmuramoyl-tripeptide--D-alanyl-D-alanine ligase [Pelotomaculum sp.]